jgi:hypothetical protein
MMLSLVIREEKKKKTWLIDSRDGLNKDNKSGGG